MASLKENLTLREYQDFVREVYGLSNDRHFDAQDMISNVERFLTRSLKGIRKGDVDKAKFNMIISFSWLLSLLNQLHVDIEQEVWERFPCACSYCASRPCKCKEKRLEHRQEVQIDNSMKPATLSGFQKMFREIYPPSLRTAEHAGIHLAEEMGELSEAILAYRSSRENGDFEKVALEAADLVSCLIGVFNSLDVDIAHELAAYYSDGCHQCHHSPCECNFQTVLSFKS